MKAGDNIVVNVALFIARIDRAKREVEQVVDDEQQDEQPAVDHCPAGERGLQVFSVAIADGAAGVVTGGELDGRTDVDDEGGDQDDACDPEELGEAEEWLADGSEEAAVIIEEGGAGVDFEIAPEVDDQVAEPDQAGDGHDV